MTAPATTCTIPGRATAIIGHRGASHDAPENTIAAFKLGFAQGADGCELDFHSTKDHRLVVIHDPTTIRVAGVNKKVSEQTFEELRSLEVGQWGHWKGKGFAEKLPTLDEALATIPDGRKLFLHCYCEMHEIAQLPEIIKRSNTTPDQVAFICFNLEDCIAFKELLPKHKAYWLRDRGDPPPTLDELIDEAKAAKLDGLDLSSDFPFDEAMVTRVHNAGLEMHVWTVDDPIKARRLAAAGVDSITTNRPGWLRSHLTQETENRPK